MDTHNRLVGRQVGEQQNEVPSRPTIRPMYTRLKDHIGFRYTSLLQSGLFKQSKPYSPFGRVYMYTAAKNDVETSICRFDERKQFFLPFHVVTIQIAIVGLEEQKDSKKYSIIHLGLSKNLSTVLTNKEIYLEYGVITETRPQEKCPDN